MIGCRFGFTTRFAPRFTMGLAAAGVTLASVMASPADAAPWRAFKALKFYVSDDVDEGARVFSQKGHFLVAPGESEFVYLLNPKGFAVHRAASEAVFDGDAPNVDPANLEAWENLGVLDKTGPALSWEDDIGRYSLSAKAPLIGTATLEELTKYTDKYDLDIEEYGPNPEIVKSLSSITVPTEFVVGFGLWCSICAEWLPKFIKTIEAADNEHFTVTYISINEDLDRPADQLEYYQLDNVPTFVVWQDGEELGRIDTDFIELEGEPPMEEMLIGIFNRE